ncbi:MAG: flagellar motor switch phosphatase FliY [Bacillota bacterium]
MSEMLSQEEIDALLRGDSSSTSQPEPISYDILSDEEKDALGEIGNISMGTSATTLFTLLNQKVSITTPRVNILSWEEMGREYEEPYVAVQVEYTSGLEGTNLLILKESDVKIITDLMMGGAGADNGEPVNDLHLSAISEAMNQMIGSSSTSLATMFNKKIDISPPRAFLINFHEGIDIEEFKSDEKIVRISFKMEVGDIIDSEIMQILPIDFAKELVDNLLGGMSMMEPEPKEPPKQEAPQKSAPPKEEAAPAVKQEVPRKPSPSAGQQLNVPHAAQAAHREEPRVVNVQPIQYQSFESEQWSTERESIDLIMDVPLEITVELGRTKKLIKDILEFGPGTILELDKLAGEPVDILVNGKFIAKGEVVVIDESFGVRITDIVNASKRLNKIQ